MFALRCTAEALAENNVIRCERNLYHSGNHVSGALDWQQGSTHACTGLCAFTECGGAA